MQGVAELPQVPAHHHTPTLTVMEDNPALFRLEAEELSNKVAGFIDEHPEAMYGQPMDLGWKERRKALKSYWYLVKVRIIHEGVEVTAHSRCWDRRRHIQDPAHIEELIERRKAARPHSRRETLAAVCPESRLYFQEISRRRIRLDTEMSRIFRLIDVYGQSEVAGAIAKAVGQRSFGAKYVRALCDQARFARGLGEPPEPIVTGNREADSLEIQPHNMESYDDLF